MKAEYDIIVIGAGLSSLMFLSKMVSNKSKLSILVLEQKDSIVRNQSFCVWEGPGLINIEKEFKLLKATFDTLKTLKTENCKLQTISMGMSGDYQLAIACGSTMVRVGSSIFGYRN